MRCSDWRYWWSLIYEKRGWKIRSWLRLLALTIMLTAVRRGRWCLCCSNRVLLTARFRADYGQPRSYPASTVRIGPEKCSGQIPRRAGGDKAATIELMRHGQYLSWSRSTRKAPGLGASRHARHSALGSGLPRMCGSLSCCSRFRAQGLQEFGGGQGIDDVVFFQPAPPRHSHPIPDKG